MKSFHPVEKENGLSKCKNLDKPPRKMKTRGVFHHTKLPSHSLKSESSVGK